MKINNREIGLNHPTYIVAEISANHHQDFQEAVKLVETAKKVGADAVKLQTYTPDTMTIDSDAPYFRVGKGSLWSGRTLYDLYREAHTPWEWQPKLKEIADKIGIDLFSSPFDSTAVDLLEKMKVPAYKVASFEIIDLPLIENIAKTRKPIIISTGMASLEEIEEAINAARSSGALEIALLKCTSAYPAPAEEMNLCAIPYLREKFKVPVGLSDHTLGITIPIAAVALGACIIEKHFILSRNQSGPDSAFSVEPDEFREMVTSIRQIEKARGKEHYTVGKEEMKSRVFRRSIFVVKDISKGELFNSENVRLIRPGNGLPPKYINKVLGKKASQDIQRGTPLSWELIS